MKNDFAHFCKVIANCLGLELCPSHDKERMGTMWSSKDTGETYDLHLDFTCYSLERQDYYCELTDRNGHYLGAISQEGDTYEHFEVAVSPFGLYRESDGNPVNPDGELIDGEGQVYYRGKSAAWAAKSLMRGGSEKGRKPIEVF